MANWEKLNKEFDDVINNMTKEDWDNWKKRCDDRKLEKNTIENYNKIEEAEILIEMLNNNRT